MVSSLNPNFGFRFETWVPSVTKLISSFSSIPPLCLLHGKYKFLPCAWVLVFFGLLVIYAINKDHCHVLDHKGIF